MTAPDAIRSARPDLTADLMRRTGLDDAMLSRLVHGFYDRVRRDPLLGPVFADRITDWGPHLDRMVEFWSSVALMTGRYHGAPMPKHLPLPVEAEHFDRWLALFHQSVDDLFQGPKAEDAKFRALTIAETWRAKFTGPFARK